MKRIQKVFLSFLLILMSLPLLANESSLTRYPRASLDRPYTLTEGLNLWRFVASGATVSQNKEPVTTYLSFFPLFWEQGINDSFTLLWSPIPIALRYQIINSNKFRFGLTANALGSPLFRSKDFTWSPYMQAEFRYRASSWLGFEASYFGQVEVRKSVGGFNSTQSFSLGPAFQLTKNLFASSQLRFLFETGGVRALYFGPEPQGSSSLRLRLPLQAKLSWFFSKSWEIETELVYLRFKYPSNYVSSQIFTSVVHYF